jgi:hypothetical protein
MSSGTVATVSLAAVPLIGVGALGYAVGTGVASIAIAAANQLQSDYQKAKAEMAAQAARVAAENLQWATEAAQRGRAASDLMARFAQPEGDAAALYTRNRLAQLAKRAESAGAADLAKEAELLLEEAGKDPASVLDRLFRLAEAVDLAMTQRAKAAPNSAPTAEALFDAFDDELEPLTFGEKKAKSQCEDQSRRLRQMASTNPAMAIQGLELLRAKVRRLARESLIEAETQRKERGRRLELVGEIVSRLRAVASCGAAPTESRAAEEAMKSFSAYLARPGGGSVRDLEGFLQKAEALFKQCQERLDLAVSAAIVQDIVSSALLERGYKISAVPSEAEASGLVSLDQNLGLTFEIDRDGQIRTEAVALNPESAEPDSASEERVCALVDEIYASLRNKGVAVKERGRRRRKPSEKLPVVNLSQTDAPRHAQTPNARTLPR